MPELPEVETTCSGIAPYLEHKKIDKVVVREGRLRWPVDDDLPAKLRNKTVDSIFRRAKYILLQFEHGFLAIHLGMSGSLKVVLDGSAAQKHDHIDMVVKGGELIRFHDPRRFGSFVWIEGPFAEHQLFKHLGPEPLSESFNLDYLYQASRNRKVSVKSFIMNANIVVGVGNIYANEALFLSGIAPAREAGGISKKRYQQLLDNIKSVLKSAIKQGGTTLKDFADPSGKPGYFVQELMVYGKKGLPCPKCSKPLTEIRLGQRSTIFCKKCQK